MYGYGRHDFFQVQACKQYIFQYPFLLLTTIGLPPFEMAAPTYVHLECRPAILPRLLRGPYLDLETPLLPLEQLLSKSGSQLAVLAR